jgi:drug/metabolite transporter (DMT)-like permease
LTAPARLSADALSRWGVLAALVVIWGSAYAGLTIAVETIDPIWTASGRLVGAALFLLIVRLVLSSRRGAITAAAVPLTALGWYVLIGVGFTAIPFFLYAIAAQTTASAILSICNGGSPFFTAIFAHACLGGERIDGRRAMGVCLGFAGLALLVLPGEGAAAAGSSGTGVVLAILGAGLYAAGNVATRMAPPLPAVTSSLIMTASGGLAAVCVAIASAPFPVGASPSSVLALAMLALFPTGLATILYVWLIRRAGPMFVAYITYIAPLFAALIGVGFLGETFTVLMAGAMLLVLAGVLVSNGAFSRRRD